MNKKRITKSIAVILLSAFFINICCYGQGLSISQQHTLAPPSIFQESSPTEDSKEFKGSVISDVNLLGVCLSIARYFLIDEKDKEGLIKYLRDKFRNERKSIELVTALAQKADFARNRKKERIVALIPYEREGEKYVIKIYNKNKLRYVKKENTDWGVFDEYGRFRDFGGFGVQIIDTMKETQTRIQRIYESLPASERGKIEVVFNAIGSPQGVSEIWRFFRGKISDEEIRQALLSVVEYSRWSTEFFRVGKEELENYLDEIIPEKIKNKDFSITAKSVGISSGEEPYSIAISIFNRLKAYHDAHKRKIGVPFGEWLSRWNITVEAYDKALVSLLLTQSGRHDLRYSNPMGIDNGMDKYASIPELHDEKIWEGSGHNSGFEFLFRKGLFDIVHGSLDKGILLPYRLRSPIRDWIKPTRVNVETPQDMYIIEETEADIVSCCYLEGSRREIKPFIKNSLHSCLTSKNKAFFAIGKDVGIVNPINTEQDMESIHDINMGLFPSVETGKTLWHVIPVELIPPSIRKRGLVRRIRQMQNKIPGLKERIRFVNSRNLHRVVSTLTMDENNIVEVALNNEEDLKELPERVKALVFKGDAGDYKSFKQLELIITALRALYKNDAKTLIKLYNIVSDEPFSGSETDIINNINNPARLAEYIKFNLKPIEIHDPEALRKLNEQLIQLIQSA